MELIVLCPFYDSIRPETEIGLRALEVGGARVVRTQGTGIAKMRSELAEQALRTNASHFMWIDSDIAFDPHNVTKLASHNQDFVSGPYFQRRSGGKAVFKPLDQSQPIILGTGGKLIELMSCGFGFVLTSREVFVRVGKDLPILKGGFRPYFFESLVDDNGVLDWTSEDISFCAKTRAQGIRIFCDMSIRLFHIGSYLYSAEDAQPKPIFETLELKAGVAP